MKGELSVLTGPTRSLNPVPLHRTFEEAAKKFPERQAVISEDESKGYTYKQLNALTDALSHRISEKLPKTSEDVIVAVSIAPSKKLVAVLLAVWKAGAAYFPIFGFCPARVEYVLKEVQPDMIIYEGEDKEAFGNITKISVEELFASSQNGEPTNRTQDLAIVLFTSGSAGVPKGVRLTHSCISNRLEWQFRAFPYQENETKAVFKTSLTFVDSVSELWGPLLKGLTLIVVPKKTTQNPHELIELLERHKVQRLILVPSLLRALLAYIKMQTNDGSKKRLSHLKFWILSGETLTVSLVKEFYEHLPDGPQLCNFYGSTEVMGDVTFHVASRNEDVVPIGKAIDNTEIYILDESLKIIPLGQIGEIFISGRNLSAGHVRSDLRRFLDNPFSHNYNKMYRSGDFGKIVNGTLIFEGRTDSQVKIRGQRVDLSEVEKAVSEVQGVANAIVLFYSPRESDQAILAFVLTDGSITEQDVERHFPKRLASYMVPEVVLVEEFPFLVNGKIDRQELLRLYSCGTKSLDFTGVPEEMMEPARVLFEIVASLSKALRHTKISPESNFFDIGGNSLNCIFTISKLQEAGYHIAIDDFVKASNLKEIFTKLTTEKVSTSSVSGYYAEPLQEHHRPLLFEILSTTYHRKCPLVKYLHCEIAKEEAYEEMIDGMWKPVMEQGLSFIIKAEDRIVGISINYDAFRAPIVCLNSELRLLGRCIEEAENISYQKYVPGPGTSMYQGWIGTHESVSPRENIQVFRFAEEENVRVAKKRGYTGIIATNVVSLSQDLATNVYQYTLLVDKQLNQFLAENNTRPFAAAPDSQRILVQYKTL